MPAQSTIQIQRVNTAPGITAPSTANGTVNVPYAFTGAGNTVSVSDVDADGGAVKVTLTGVDGNISALGPTGALVITGGPLPSLSITLTGTLTDQNTALAGLQFTPAIAGAVSLTVAIDDQGNTGSGSPLTANKQINFTVVP